MNLPSSNARYPISLAVVGAGYWGPNLIRDLAALPECRLAVVCDLSPARLAVYEEFLAQMAERVQQSDASGAPAFWHALPRDVARRWRRRW